jgi:hypothetical protein
MPNWVYNVVTLSGPSEQLEELYTDWCKPTEDREGFSFRNLVPRPAEHHDDWYNWNVSNWGTKWDACEPHESREVDGLTIFFETAWSPPEPIFDVLRKACYQQGLGLVVSFEEEQGWGGVWELTPRGTWKVEEWDIPNCHEDYVSRGKTCYCEFFPDEERPFSDCPPQAD